jgi:hypothetical protein
MKQASQSELNNWYINMLNIFYWFGYYVVAHGTNIFYYYFVPQRLQHLRIHTHSPPDVGRAVWAVHTLCGVPTACSARHHPRPADDALHHIDITCEPVASGDTHVPPFVWWDYNDATGRHHDPWSSHWWHSCLWDGVFRRVEGLRRRGYRHSTPNIPTDQKDKKTTGVHSGWLIANFNTCSEGAKDTVIQRYVLYCVWHMDDEWQFAKLI